ncbi:glycosyltransferase family A protein [Lysinibacillus sphaericus]|uniref:glycosyltransferase family A protein n=1 Tax=Lysinibacillus sphaericus TaxID=1421 RepID=UPI0019105F53|nr:glycosyltransferase family A protein [Lysinibacillus sphaericus]QPA55074.1 glycosyltransferase [Lysinibacillus sphaericus]
MDNIKISVVIPAFNAELYIEKAIQSILRQTVHVNEIIIIDDGSVDQTCKIVRNIQKDEPKIVLLTQKNAGASAARNRGIHEATGDWILFLDADDECSKELVKIYVTKIKEATEKFSMMYTAYFQIDMNSHIISPKLSGKRLSAIEGFCDILIRNPIISPSGVIVYKELLLEMTGFNTTIKYDEDVDLWVRLLDKDYSIEYIDRPLSFIRRHSNNTTSSMNTSHNAEKLIMDQYGLDYIKEKLYKRSYTMEKNSLDFALFLIRYKHWKQCEELLENTWILEDSPHYNSYCFLKSIVYIEDKRFDEALDEYEKILVADVTHGAALNNSGVIYAMNGNKEQAITNMEQALLLFPGYLDVKHNMTLLENGGTDKSLFRFTLRELRPVLLSYSTD